MSAEKQIPTADERSSFGGGKSVQFGTLSCVLDHCHAGDPIDGPAVGNWAG